MTERFAVEFEPVGGAAWRDVPAAIRLRRLLKAATRSYGLRCTGARTAQQPPSGGAAPEGLPPAVPPPVTAGDGRSHAAGDGSPTAGPLLDPCACGTEATGTAAAVEVHGRRCRPEGAANRGPQLTHSELTP